MADTTYTIQLIDQASAAGRRVEKALTGVDRAARRSAAAAGPFGAAHRKAASAAERTAKAELKLARTLAATSRAAIANGRAMDRLGAKTDKAGKKVSSLGTFATVAGAAMAGRFAIGAATAGIAMIKATGEADLLRDTFNRVAGNKTEFPEIQKQVRSLGLDLVEGEKAALKLRAVFGKITTSKFLDFFKATNLQTDEITRASLALSQIQGRGKLQGEELNQFAEAVPGFNRGEVIKSIAKTLKISLAAAGKKLKTGQVSANVGIKALFEGSLKSLKINDLNKQLKKVEFSTPARLARIGNDVTAAKRAIGKALESTSFLPGLEGLSKGLVHVTKFLGPSGLSAAIEAVAVSFGVLTVAVVGFGIKAAIAWAAAAAPAVLFAGAVAAVAGSFLFLWRSIERFNALGGVTGLFEVLRLEFPKITMAIDQVVGVFTRLWNILKLVSEASANFALSTPFAKLGRFAAETLGIDAGSGMEFQSAKDLADGTVAENATRGASGPSRAALAAAGASAGATVNRAGGTVGKVDFNINVDGSRDPVATGAAVKEAAESGFVSFIERHLEGIGA